jgi:hypothetical protein
VDGTMEMRVTIIVFVVLGSVPVLAPRSSDLGLPSQSVSRSECAIIRAIRARVREQRWNNGLVRRMGLNF